MLLYFNPRSLAGATTGLYAVRFRYTISIHAPLRERRVAFVAVIYDLLFQSTLPCGSDKKVRKCGTLQDISIHAPLRERR